MLSEKFHLTPYAGINIVLHDFLTHIQAILGSHFCGMYLTGSLAFGDFDPRRSDIDFIVVTDAELPDDRFVALQNMHARFGESSSSWAEKIEAVYIPQDALRRAALTSEQFPQVEKGTALFKDRLESGWIFQCYILREHAIVVAGPDGRYLFINRGLYHLQMPRRPRPKAAHSKPRGVIRYGALLDGTEG
ncbi:MAG TPA: nucleotidyltransferase domain-containing protein [Ktedonobacteraceae bacterium]|nr:nucleotidyltransferase domain-containing protein [Ktedonobacteraceae bacterium]